MEEAGRERVRVLDAATAAFAAKGFEGATMEEIATQAGVPLARLCLEHPTKEHLALALYARLAEELTELAAELPEGEVAERFAFVMAHKLRVIEPLRGALVALAGKAVDPDARAGVLGAAAEPVRSRVAAIFDAVVRGARDAPADAPRAARALYGAHLALILLWLQRGDHESLVALARDVARGLPMLAAMTPMVERLEHLVGARLPAQGEGHEASARVILQRILRRRRVFADVPPEPTEATFALHSPRVRAFLEAGTPISLVLPAFPAKAPSRRKVLGTRPDMAEALALRALATLLDEIEEAHAPGAELVICSDGTVFADVVGVRAEDVSSYRAGLEAMLREMGERRVRLFDLADALGELPPDAARAALLARYAEDAAALRERAARSPAFARQVDGIHRFVVEDELAKEDGRSKSQIKREARERAYEVVRRSDAWGRLVAAFFPDAIRLSIHPQPDVSAKIGIHLVATEDAWLTPWHGCAVLHGGRFELMKRADAEARGARVVEAELPHMVIG
ncbi:MAG: L-tyrosine/L-tryptophan isonitrile synthase family protein [Sandaracinaceae bacterium]|nr:L-tyrosine/L-tryptophan isonitrile synthase family protein [Sandaracinaceae bacterium]